jgi:hypothetical protein
MVQWVYRPYHLSESLIYRTDVFTSAMKLLTGFFMVLGMGVGSSSRIVWKLCSPLWHIKKTLSSTFNKWQALSSVLQSKPRRGHQLIAFRELLG